MPATKNAVRIPEGISQHHDAINKILKDILGELQKLSGAKEMFVNCRLNKSDQKTGPSPVCVGWVESKALEEQRKKIGLGDPATTRFGDEHLSSVYAECLCDSTDVKERDYSKPDAAFKQKNVGSRGYDVALKQAYRRYACIIAGGRRAGTLTVGSTTAPSKADDTKVKQALTDWAQDLKKKKDLIEHLQTNFVLGGPPAQKE